MIVPGFSLTGSFEAVRRLVFSSFRFRVNQGVSVLRKTP
jgi:hypothetical protein